MASKRIPNASEMGKKGGANSRKYMTAEQRRELAQRAARARWGDKKKGS